MDGTRKRQKAQGERVWLVGGSSGIGMALVKVWLKQGKRLVVSARTATQNDELQKLVQAFDGQLRLIDIDVTDSSTLTQEVLDQVWQAYEGLDLWFYNAGAYQPMTLNDWDEKVFINLAQTNYLGAVRLMVRLLPYFRKYGGGRWVWNVSLSADFGLPYGGAYSAPKAALLNLAQSIQPELATEGIQLQVINHGFVHTRLTAKNDFPMPGVMEASEAAVKIAQAVDHGKGFEIRFPFGLGTLLRLLKLLPYRLSLAMTKKMLNNKDDVK
ncbi:SDR family NAD(P)-dependent oxidoreductase [Galenea microaerophila]